jgi:hypothetical protein
MAALGLLVGTLGVGDPAQVADDPPQPTRIQPPGASTNTGSASAASWAGRSWVPWARTVA